MGTTTIICGLTTYEKECIKQHQGECSWCEHNDSYITERNTLVRQCSKKGALKEFETDCKEWKLDMR